MVSRRQQLCPRWSTQLTFEIRQTWTQSKNKLSLVLNVWILLVNNIPWSWVSWAAITFTKQQHKSTSGSIKIYQYFYRNTAQVCNLRAQEEGRRHIYSGITSLNRSLSIFVSVGSHRLLAPLSTTVSEAVAHEIFQGNSEQKNSTPFPPPPHTCTDWHFQL